MKEQPYKLKSCTAHDAVQILNEALKLDPVAVAALVAARVPCNDGLAEHPTITVGPMERGGPDMVGLLGILNGIFADDGARAPIALLMDSRELIEGDRVTVQELPLRFALRGLPGVDAITET